MNQSKKDTTYTTKNSSTKYLLTSTKGPLFVEAWNGILSIPACILHTHSQTLIYVWCCLTCKWVFRGPLDTTRSKSLFHGYWASWYHRAGWHLLWQVQLWQSHCRHLKHEEDSCYNKKKDEGSFSPFSRVSSRKPLHVKSAWISFSFFTSYRSSSMSLKKRIRLTTRSQARKMLFNRSNSLKSLVYYYTCKDIKSYYIRACSNNSINSSLLHFLQSGHTGATSLHCFVVSHHGRGLKSNLFKTFINIFMITIYVFEYGITMLFFVFNS